MTARPLRICMPTTFYPPHNFGGDGIAVQRLARALVRRGHEVTVIANADAFAALGGVSEPVSRDDDDGVRVHRVSTSTPRLSSLVTHQTGQPLATRAAIRALLAGDKFDVIHYQNVSLVGGPAILSEGHGIKLYTAHEHWLVCATHVLWRHRTEPCPARQCFRCQLAYRRPPQLWRYTGYLERQLRHVDAFIACSEFSRAKHHEMGFQHEMTVIPPMLENLPYDVPNTGSPHPRPYFLFVGRLERLKGLDDVIPVMRAYPHADLLVIGDGSHRSALERIAGQSPQIRFEGRVATHDLGRYYEHAIAVIVPSIGFETFGFVAVESLRQGTPVIARRRGPLTEIVEASGAGDLFETPDQLRASLERMQSEPFRRAALASAGRTAFDARWSERAVLPTYLDLIEQVARTRGAQHIIEALASGRAA